MRSDANSKKIADQLIDWICHYAPLQGDALVANEQRYVPPHIFLDLGNQGFLGMSISRKYGGLELKTQDVLHVLEQVATLDLTLALILIKSIQAAYTVEKYATDPMKNHYLPLLAKGRIVIASPMVETDDAHPNTITTSTNSEGWCLTGTEPWVGMAGAATITIIYAHHPNESGMSGFLIFQGVKGLSIDAETPTMGLKGLAKHTIHLDAVKVLPEQLLGLSGQGMAVAQDSMMYGHRCLAAATLGGMKQGVHLMLHQLRQHTMTVDPLIDNPVILARLSEMTAVIDALDNFVYLIAYLYDHDPIMTPQETFVIAKLLGSTYLGWVIDMVVQTLGVSGYQEGSVVTKLFRDARAFRLIGGTTDALHVYLGAKILANNTHLEPLIATALQQKELFNEIKRAVDSVNKYCLSNKHKLFTKPVAVNHWTQVLVSDIVAYGLLLATLNYSNQKKPSDMLQRATIWARNKYQDVVQRALTYSLAERVLLQPKLLQEVLARYYRG